MSGNNDNPLNHPPFFHIQGVDPAAPISAQTERIDQLNTLLLQDIDANFARFHQIITSKILPQIKRYAIASEPTREAAQFWRAFFETASAVRLSNQQGDTSLNSQNQDTSTQYDDQTFTLRREADDSSVHPSTEESFMFDPPPGISSTPLPAGRNGPGGRQNDSWEDSMESPFDRLDRKLRDDLKIDEGEGYEQSSSDMPTPSLPSGYSLPRLDGDSSVMSSINDYSVGNIEPSQATTDSSASFSQTHSRLAQSYRASPTPKANRLANPPPADSNPFGKDFTGVVDLRSTPLNMKKKGQGWKPKASIVPGLDDSDSDSDDGMPAGMSPPVTMSFNLPPRAQAVMNAARTPGKGKEKESAGGKEKEAKFILDDLLEEMSQDMSPRLETPEALRRYSVMPSDNIPGRLLFSDSSIRPDAIGEEDEDEDQTFHATQSSHSHSHSHSQSQSQSSYHPPAPTQQEPYLPPPPPPHARQSLANSSFGSNASFTQIPGGPVLYSDANEEDSFDEGDTFDDDDSGEISSLHVPSTGSSAHPGFGMNYHQQPGGYQVPSLGQGQNQEMVDASFASSEGDVTNTSLFGGRGGRAPAAGGFALMTREEMDTYRGGRLEDAAGEDVMLSPLYAPGREGR
ncbi:hypothetical protein L202_07098 [Cryptococcus amylolentus CBS 6039]|uniref:DASH complex subunit ASK1 n=1 Tax=Cryptococcus amylolentus CBS 6039 TaxID=1295533 RepID=A0A1E3HEK9_9TREE|nr:hypothetical protein L202_07098 [Cryptococcus amylolentus CBS 6039]ODN74777.1 hypothetical protein L202_07098 [Cryptococcus amylolentus CBS 6039]